jgi:biopolymer transport protein TolR
MTMMLRGRRTVSSEINVTPMLDVLLVLLSICMVVFPYRSVGEMALIPQRNTELVLKPENTIVIEIKQAVSAQRPSLRINEEELKWESLGSRLHEIYSKGLDQVAFLKGDQEIEFQYVAEVLDTTHHAGVTRVALLGTDERGTKPAPTPDR